MFSLLRSDRLQMELLGHLVWHGIRAHSPAFPAILDPGAPTATLLLTHTQDISSVWKLFFSWCALAWGRASNKGRDLWLLAMFMLCLPMGSRTASRTCARCTVFSIFSSSSDGVQVSLQVQQKWSEDPGFRRGPCIAMLQPDSWSGRGMLPALLPTLEIDGLSPSQIITRYFS